MDRPPIAHKPPPLLDKVYFFSTEKLELAYSPNLFKLLVLLLILFPAASIAEAYISNKAGGKNVWYQLHNSPHAMYQNGKTYLVFHGGGEDYLDPLIVSYDHSSKQVVGPIKAGDNPLSDLSDEHGNPAVMVDALGHIHVFFGGHGNIGKMIHAVSKHPNDISTWRIIENINPKATYPQLLRTSDGTIYYFYRKGNHRDDWVFVTSSDNGLTFNHETSVIQAGTKRLDKRYHESPYYDSWYSVFWLDRNDTIHHVTRYHACANDYKSPYHLERRVNVYYMKKDHKSDYWTSLAGDKLLTPVTREAADKCCRLFLSNPPKGEGNVRKILFSGFDVDEAGRPYIVFGHGKGPNGRIDRSWELAIGDSKNNNWSFKKLPHGGQLTIEKDGSLRLWSSKVKQSHDQGKSWKTMSTIKRGGFSGISLVVNGRANARVVGYDPWRETKDYSKRKVFLWGDQGFITSKNATRSHSER